MTLEEVQEFIKKHCQFVIAPAEEYADGKTLDPNSFVVWEVVPRAEYAFGGTLADCQKWIEEQKK